MPQAKRTHCSITRTCRATITFGNSPAFPVRLDQTQKKRKPTHRSQRKKRFAAPSNMTDPTDLAVQRPQHRTDTDSPSSLSPNESQNTGTPIPPNEAHSTNDPTAPSATPGTEPFEFESRPENWETMSQKQKKLWRKRNPS